MKQAIIIIIISIGFGFVFNAVRSNGISLLKKPLPVLQNTSDISRNDADNESGIRMINLEQARDFYQEGVLFVDARDGQAYSDGHITGAISGANFFELLEQLVEITTMDLPLVTYCSDEECGVSEDLAYALQEEGFSNLLVFKGGWDEWILAEYEISK
ncbi:MAG: rhodanese-like domain-containing protein [Candidatus Neomarinimicrobiota bacterium]